MKNALTAIIIGLFALMSHLTAGDISSAISNDLDNTPQIDIQLDRIECTSNQTLAGTFRLTLHAGNQEIYNEIIDFSAGSRIITEQIPTARIEDLDIFGAELVISLESVESGTVDSYSVGILDVAQNFEAVLQVQGANLTSGMLIQGSIRLE